MIILDVAVLAAVLPGARADLKGSVCQCHYCNCARGNSSKPCSSVYFIFIYLLLLGNLYCLPKHAGLGYTTYSNGENMTHLIIVLLYYTCIIDMVCVFQVY